VSYPDKCLLYIKKGGGYFSSAVVLFGNVIEIKELDYNAVMGSASKLFRADI